MIGTQEQYEMLKRVLGPPYPVDIQEEEFAAFIETIEALREVARESKKLLKLLELSDFPRGDEERDLDSILVALPDWIINE